MKLAMGMAALISAGFVLPAFAGEMADACVATLEADGRDTSGCSCLEEKVMSDAALAEEFTSTLADIEDPQARYDAASVDAKAAMDECTR